MRRGLLKVARADAVKACSSKWSERHVVGVWFPALVKQARLEGATLAILPFFAKCSDGGVAPAFVIARGWKRAPPAVPYFAIAAHLNDCVYALMRESRETSWFE